MYHLNLWVFLRHGLRDKIHLIVSLHKIISFSIHKVCEKYFLGSSHIKVFFAQRELLLCLCQKTERRFCMERSGSS